MGDQTKTSQTTTPLASSNNQETSAATSNIINVIAENISQPKSPCPKSSSISTVDLVVSHSPITSATLTTVTSSGTSATTVTTTKGEISSTTSQSVLPILADTETTSTPITKNFVKSTSNRPPPLQKLHRSYTTIDRDKINKANSGSFNRKFQKPEVTPNTNSSQPGSPKILSLKKASTSR